MKFVLEDLCVNVLCPIPSEPFIFGADALFGCQEAAQRAAVDMGEIGLTVCGAYKREYYEEKKMLEGAGTEGGSVHGPNASSTVAAGQQFVYHLLFVIPLSLSYRY